MLSYVEIESLRHLWSLLAFKCLRQPQQQNPLSSRGGPLASLTTFSSRTDHLQVCASYSDNVCINIFSHPINNVSFDDADDRL